MSDRDSDVYHYWQRALQLKWHCLLRARSDHCVLDEDGKPSMLMEQVKRLEPMASQEVDLRSRPGVAARIAHLSIAWAKVSVKPPKNDPRLRTATPLQMWVIHVWEVHAPDGITPLSWILLSTLPVESAEQAAEKKAWYRLRWKIETYHQ